MNELLIMFLEEVEKVGTLIVEALNEIYFFNTYTYEIDGNSLFISDRESNLKINNIKTIKMECNNLLIDTKDGTMMMCLM